MSIILPGIVADALDILGFTWPNLDEDKIREHARAWKTFAADLEFVIADTDRAARTVAQDNHGESISAFTGHWAGVGGQGDLREAADAAKLVGDALEIFAGIVEGLKYAVIAEASVTAALIVGTAGAALLARGALTAVLRKLKKEAIQEILSRIVPKISQEAKERFARILRNPLPNPFGPRPALAGMPGNTAGSIPDLNIMAIVGKKKSPTHGTSQKRAGIKEGPVQIRPHKGASKEELDQYQEYIDAANRAKDQGQLSPTGRVKVDGELKVDKERAAARERINQERAGEPYGDDQAAHLPDTTWTGTAEPPQGWGRHTAAVNRNIGAQSGTYPEGYNPTEFELGEPR